MYDLFQFFIFFFWFQAILRRNSFLPIIMYTSNQYLMHKPQKVFLQPKCALHRCVMGNFCRVLMIYKLKNIGKLSKTIGEYKKRGENDSSYSSVNHPKNEILIGLLYMRSIESNTIIKRERSRVLWNKNQFVRIFIIVWSVYSVVNHTFMGYNAH